MPERIFLKKQSALASQVAEILLQGGRDLSAVEVWIPTSGAGRRIRRALAEKGVLSPRFTQSMRALLPDGVRLAERFEREAAWARALKEVKREFLEPLFSDAKLDTDAARLKSGGVLCELCDLLAEAGWSPSDVRVGEVCSEDEARWEVLNGVYQCYLAVLKDCDLTDPNEARFVKIANPSRVAGLQRLVIACVSDLPLASQRYAEALEKLGVKVEVLVWLPGEVGGGFDTWGRPNPDEWATCRVAIDAFQMGVAGSPEDEAREGLDFATASNPLGAYEVVLADPKLGSIFRSEVESRCGQAFLPDGGRLDLSEAGVIALEWVRFQSLGDLRVLRRLLELPRFQRVLRGDSTLKADDMLAVCDYLIGEVVLSGLPQAEAFAAVDFDPKKEKSERRAQSQIFVGLVKSLLAASVPELLAMAWRSGGDGLETARKVVSLHESIAESPLFEDAPDGVENAFARALKSTPLFESSERGDVELSGWLEAPWTEAARLALCGCTEGCMPSSINGHAFLPDSKRRMLGLAYNKSRFARDAHILQCLLLARPVGEFRISFSRFDAEGSPTLPSSLFLRCEEEALPARVLKLFGELSSGGTRWPRINNWKWRLPETMRCRVEKISPTDFSEYLACPFRYYLKKAQWLDSFTPDAREMDAKRFGSLVHEVLEKFGRETPDISDPFEIERLVFAHLDASVIYYFGPTPSPAVRLQIEAAKIRLRGFARVQAEQFAAGWRIIEVERKLDANGANAFQISPLKLSGKIDRIEKNNHTGTWRVVDYKTHSNSTAPSKKHFGSRLSSEWLPEAEVSYVEAGKSKNKRWADLQLPLYREILRHWYATQIGDSSIVTAYFTLCADPDESSLHEFTQLDAAVVDSAIKCAREIAQRVHKGEFWPPQPLASSWDDPFEALLINGKLESCFTDETITFLKGNL